MNATTTSRIALQQVASALWRGLFFGVLNTLVVPHRQTRFIGLPERGPSGCTLMSELTNPYNKELGDIPADLFRRHLHELADWIADYREKISERRVSPDAAPGAIL